MLGVSGMLGNSGGDGGATAAASAAGGVRESGGSGSDGGGCGGGGETGGIGPNSGGFSEEEKVRGEEVDRSWGGNRWPRQETLALLQIRSDMDVAFRDSSLKGPLWEEVSRKLAELGYHRSAKKCKEKFENVYKYHRRTKEVRASKQDGKSYRFFDQLEALENQAPPPSPPSILPPPPHPPRSQTYHVTAAIPLAAVAMPATTNPPNPIISQFTVPSTANPTSVSQNQNVATPTTNRTNPPPSNPFPAPAPVSTLANPINLPNYHTGIPSSNQNMSANLAAMSTSSSTSSDDEPERLREKKRKWVGFFQKLMSEVIEKQEEMQKKFLETLEKRERERVAREEAWRAQEMARMNREHDLLVHERSIAAAKDAAVIAFLQKVSEPQIPNAVAQIQMQAQDNSMPPPPPPPPPALQSQSQPPLQPPPPPPPLQLPPQKSLDNPKTDNGGENFIPTSSSRWPKVEVQALIRTRTNMDFKYQENGPKGPLWEDISAAMRKLGYDRSAKRCKEKWENINKYFKKVKESNKKRPEDSKTCPYFQQLEALYKEKAKNENNSPFNSGFATKPENSMVPIMVQPEQQWPLLQEHHRRPETAAMGVEDDDSENTEQNHDDDDDEDDENEEDEAAGYEIVTKKPSSVGAVE